MENRLILKDETVIHNGFASKSSDDQLMVRVLGNDLVQAAVMFSDPNKTQTIIQYYSIYKYTYTGFTDMYSIQYFSDDDYVEIWLKPEKDVTPTMEKEITVPQEYVPEEERTL